MGWKQYPWRLLSSPAALSWIIICPRSTGLKATNQIKARTALMSILGLSVIDDEHVTQAMKAVGAEAVLLKDEIHALDEAIRQWTLR